MCRRKRPPGKPNLFFYGANMLSLKNTQLTMTSQEIASLTGKEHKNVKSDIERILTEAGIDTQGFKRIYKDSQNRSQTEYALPKRECDLVISGYSVKYRLAIIDRWQELESKTPVDPMAFLNDPQAMRSVLLSYTEKVLELQPKADAFDAISNAEGELCLTDAAKYLHVPPRKFNQFLQAQGWIFKRNGSGSWTAYQRRIDQGFLTHKRVTYERNSGETEVVWQPLVTPEGIKFLSLYPAIQEIQSK